MAVKFIDNKLFIPKYSQQINNFKLTLRSCTMLTLKYSKSPIYLNCLINLNVNSFFFSIYKSQRTLFFNKYLFISNNKSVAYKSPLNSIIHLL